MKHRFLTQYVERNIEEYEDLESIIFTRLDNFGGYRFLQNKSIDEIKNYDIEDFKIIFESLYSTQRPDVRNDLITLLTMEGTGVQFFRGLINKIIKGKYMNIDEMHSNEREQVRVYERKLGEKLKFGKGTISQLAHFTKPEMYPLYNTKSEVVIYELCGKDISNTYYEFKKECNQIIEELQVLIEDKTGVSCQLFLQNHGYVLMDDFVEFAYGIIKTNEV